jgi:hypothetical protein
MIVDNADNFEIFYHNNEDRTTGTLSEYLPFSPLGTILFTTRDHKAATRYTGPNMIDINEIDDEKSREFFLQSFQNKQLIENKNNITKLLKLLINLLFAII